MLLDTAEEKGAKTVFVCIRKEATSIGFEIFVLILKANL